VIVHRRRSLALYLPVSVRKREKEEETHRVLITHSGPSKRTSCTTVQAARVARIGCAVNLEKISELLCAARAFFIAVDTSTVECTGYLDFRVHVCVMYEIENLHVRAIPQRDRHTGEIIFNEMADVLDKLCENWREKVIGVTTDGDRSMTCQVKGVASRIERETPDGMMCRVWCCLQQLDLIMQRSLKGCMRRGVLPGTDICHRSPSPPDKPHRQYGMQMPNGC
jgi:hypothetical protein